MGSIDKKLLKEIKNDIVNAVTQQCHVVGGNEEWSIEMDVNRTVKSYKFHLLSKGILPDDIDSILNDDYKKKILKLVKKRCNCVSGRYFVKSKY